MKCPKCEEGALIEIEFKTTGRIGHLCDFCEALWFGHERIAVTTGHTLNGYTHQKENKFEDLDEQDLDHRPDHDVRHL